jgi:hypothetical protein
MKISLGIKDKHILQGEMANPQNCAIARALKDRIHNLDKVGVFPSHAYLVVKKNNKTSAFKAKLNKAAAAFIKSFDEGRPVNAFKLNLNLRPIKYVKELA